MLKVRVRGGTGEKWPLSSDTRCGVDCVYQAGAEIVEARQVVPKSQADHVASVPSWTQRSEIAYINVSFEPAGMELPSSTNANCFLSDAACAVFAHLHGRDGDCRSTRSHIVIGDQLLSCLIPVPHFFFFRPCLFNWF